METYFPSCLLTPTKIGNPRSRKKVEEEEGNEHNGEGATSGIVYIHLIVESGPIIEDVGVLPGDYGGNSLTNSRKVP